MSKGLKGCVNLSHEVELHCQIDGILVLAKSFYDFSKYDNEYSVSFKSVLAEIGDPSVAAKFLQVRFTDISSFRSWVTLKDILDHK